MNSKKIISLAILLAAAVAIIAIVKTSGNRKPSDESLQFFPGATEKTIASVLIRDAQNQVKLHRKGDAWYMIPKDAIAADAKNQGTGLAGAMGKDASVPQSTPVATSDFPADSAVISQLLDNIVAMKKNTLVSENPANQSAFEVDSLRGSVVEVFDNLGKSLGKVVLGKNGADYNSIYARGAGSNSVYLMLEVSRYAFGIDNNRWTDKSIMKFDKAAAMQVSIAKKGSPALVIAKGDSAKKGWQLIEPVRKSKDTGSLDSTKVDELVSSLANLTAAEYEYAVPSDSTSGFSDPSMTVTVNLTGGTTRSIIVGNLKPGQTKYWVKVPERPYTYLINDYDQKKWDKKAEDFEKVPVKPAPAAPRPAKVKPGLKK